MCLTCYFTDFVVVVVVVVVLVVILVILVVVIACNYAVHIATTTPCVFQIYRVKETYSCFKNVFTIICLCLQRSQGQGYLLLSNQSPSLH